MRPGKEPRKLRPGNDSWDWGQEKTRELEANKTVVDGELIVQETTCSSNEALEIESQNQSN